MSSRPNENGKLSLKLKNRKHLLKHQNHQINPYPRNKLNKNVSLLRLNCEMHLFNIQCGFLAGFLKTEMDSEMTGEYTEDDEKQYQTEEGEVEGDIGAYETGSQDNGKFK